VKGFPNAGISRRRKGKRQKRPCPVHGCPAQVADLKDHMFWTSCHEDIELLVRDQLLAKANSERDVEKKKEGAGKKKRKRLMCKCPICDR
jgi:hypothetical protein